MLLCADLQWWKVDQGAVRLRPLEVGVVKLIEKGMIHRLTGRKTSVRVVLKEAVEQLHRLRRRRRYVRRKELLHRTTAEVGKLKSCIVFVHRSQLFACGRAQLADDHHKMIETRIAVKEWLALQTLSEHHARRPEICEEISI